MLPLRTLLSLVGALLGLQSTLLFHDLKHGLESETMSAAPATVELVDTTTTPRLPARNISSGIVSVEAEDRIYHNKRLSPVVVAKYRLVFFDVPKVASSAWMLLLQRLSGVNTTLTTKGFSSKNSQLMLRCLHEPKCNGLTYLFQLNITYATRIMNDASWTKATFVRNPHERLVSAYLNKGLQTRFEWIQGSCCRKTMDCIGGQENRSTFEYFVDFITSDVCRNDHWSPQSERIDDKHWPLINFVGSMEDLEQDAKLLLKRIGAWEDHGVTGWGQQGADPIFGARGSDGRAHSSGAAEQMYSFYRSSAATSDLYERVTQYYRSDYNHSILKLSPRM